MPNPFRALGKRLLRAGMTPRQVRRTLTELREHLADLTERERAAGAPDAETKARAALGDDDLLTAAILARPGLPLASRLQWLTFGLLSPLLLLIMFLHFEQSRVPVTQLFDRYAGYYRIGQQPVVTVRRDGMRLLLQVAGQPPMEIDPKGDAIFSARSLPLQVRFVTDAAGHVQSLLARNRGQEINIVRIDAAAAKNAFALLAKRVKDDVPSPGTEAFIRRHIAALQKGQPNYSEMMPVLAEAAHRQWPATQEHVRQWGAFKSLVFVRVDPQGADVYDATFAHHVVEWRISPLTADGKAEGVVFHKLS